MLFLGVMLVGVVGVASEHADDVVGSVVFAVLLVLVGVPFFLLVRWTRKRGKPIRAQEAVYRAQVEEQKKVSRETEQRAKAPRERLARLVSDTFQRTRWGGVNDHGESTDRTIWSASAWLGERPEERVKARLFGGAEAPALEDALKMGPVSTSDAGTSAKA